MSANLDLPTPTRKRPFWPILTKFCFPRPPSHLPALPSLSCNLDPQAPHRIYSHRRSGAHSKFSCSCKNAYRAYHQSPIDNPHYPSQSCVPAQSRKKSTLANIVFCTSPVPTTINIYQCSLNDNPHYPAQCFVPAHSQPQSPLHNPVHCISPFPTSISIEQRNPFYHPSSKENSN